MPHTAHVSLAMDSDEAAFLAQILAAPDDDTPRLVYADWLQEHSVAETCGQCDAGRVFGRDPQSPRRSDAWHACRRCGGTGRITDGRTARAEFIRVQCELAGLRERRYSGGTGDEDTERRRALLKREAELTLAVYPRVVWPLFDWLRSRGIDPGACVVNRGGWLAAVTCTASAWLAHGDAVLAEQPVARVRLSTTAEWDGDPDGARLVGDPRRVHISWARLRAERQPQEHDDLFPAFLRLRWPGVAFEVERR